MLNLMPSGPVPRKAGAKLQLFYKTTKFLHIFYKIIDKFLDFNKIQIVKNGLCLIICEILQTKDLRYKP